MDYKEQENRLLKDLKQRGLLDALREHNAVIAGGAIISAFTHRGINDYDVYCKTEKDCEGLKDSLRDLAFINKVTTQNAYTMVSNYEVSASSGGPDKQITIQIIKNKDFLQADIMSVFAYFDFYCCMGAYDVKEGKFVLHNRFLTDNLEKRLVFNPGTKYPICSLYRVLKYQKKGYTFSGVEAIKIALTINALDIKTYKDLKEQLQGIDTLFLRSLTDHLKKKANKKEKYNAKEFLKFFDEYTLDGLSEEVADKYLGAKEPVDLGDEDTEESTGDSLSDLLY